MRFRFDVYGVVVELESDCVEFFDLIKSDFGYFESRESEAEAGRARVSIKVKLGAPPWEEIPPGKSPLFRTINNSVFRIGSKRYVDHNRKALTIYDFAEECGTVHAETYLFLYEVAYLLILSRVGHWLDRLGVHRLHAVSVAVENKAWVFLATSGCGKTTLGLSLMRDRDVGWQGDEIPLLDSGLNVLAVPMSPRLARGGSFPWPPPPVLTREISRTKHPPKVILDTEVILPRVLQKAPLERIYLCSRDGRAKPRITRLGRFQAFIGLCNNALYGRDFPQTKAYYFRFTPVFACVMAKILVSRAIRLFVTVWRVPIYRFDMCDDVEANVRFLRSADVDGSIHLSSETGLPKGS